MDLFTVLGACLRRWYVTVPIVAVAGYLALQAYEAVPSEYTSSVSIVVLPSNAPEPLDGEPEIPTPDNPYVGSGGPRFAAAVLARNINTDGYRQLVGLADAPDITFKASANQQQPIISIDAFAPTPEAVLSTLDAVAGQAELVLRQFQTDAGAPEDKLYRIAPAVPADRVEDVTPSRFRTAGAIGVMGIALAGLMGTSVDVLARRWSARRAETRAEREAAAASAGGSARTSEDAMPPAQGRESVAGDGRPAAVKVPTAGPVTESTGPMVQKKRSREVEPPDAPSSPDGRSSVTDAGERPRQDQEAVPGR